MPLSVTPVLKVCDIQSTTDWPMWRIYNDVKNIINKNINVPYRDFLAMPVHEGDSLDDGFFYWYTPISKVAFNRLSKMGDDYGHYKAILEKTLNHYNEVIKKLEKEGKADDAEYLRLSLKYAGEWEDYVFCGEDRVVATLWGMRPRPGVEFTEAVIEGEIRPNKGLHTVKFDLKGHGNTQGELVLRKMEGSRIHPDQVPSVTASEGYEFIGWQPDPSDAEVKSDSVYEAQYRELPKPKEPPVVSDEKPPVSPVKTHPETPSSKDEAPVKHRVRFLTPDGKVIKELEVIHGEKILPGLIPQLPVFEGVLCTEWDGNPLRDVIDNDIDYTAILPKIFVPDSSIERHRIRFLMPDGKLLVETEVLHGHRLSSEQIPQLPVINGVACSAWDTDPLGDTIYADKEFTAIAPPAKNMHTVRFLAPDGNEVRRTQVAHGERLTDSQIPPLPVINGKTCRKWAPNPTTKTIKKDTDFKARKRCSPCPWHCIWGPGSGFWHWLLRILIFLMIVFLILYIVYRCNPCSACPNRRVTTPPEYEDILPPYYQDIPSIDTNHIKRRPNLPDIVDNRLNILLEDEDKSVYEFAKAFKEKYPEDKYPIVYYDTLVKRIQIECPPEERESLTSEIPEKFSPEYTLYVFDETLFTASFRPSDPDYADADKRWHLDAVQMENAWEYTKGKGGVTVAIVDNGFNLGHPELRRRAVMPYNVWTHSNHISPSPKGDHGTHVAGIALATMNNRHGICGIAPECDFMPVRVSDVNGNMTTTSILDGILYAIHQGANVVNVSLGFKFGDGLSIEQQLELQNSYFKVEERLWKEVMTMAERNNCIIVIAAGNEDILAGVDPLNRPDCFIVVSAVDHNGQALKKADFSNYGSYSDVSAPGVDIYSSFQDTYKMMSGTSMAAPMVTGAVALMKCIDPNITAKQAVCVLKSTGKPVGGNIGELIQVASALEAVKNGEHRDCTYTPTVSTGDVQILLKWNDYNDVDLRCDEPCGYSLYYKTKSRPSPTGGVFEVDMNVNYPDSPHPVENIYWPQGQAPQGTYIVYVKLFKQHQPRIAKSDYTVEVLCQGEKTLYRGSVTHEEDWVKVCEFSLQ